MKIGVLVCVLLLAGPVTRAGVEGGAFEEARRIGSGRQAAFFLFSTSFGRYVIRHDGMGELGSNGRRRMFYLSQKIRLVGRLERVYFREHEGDLLLLYQVTDGKVYLARMIQESKKICWSTLVTENAPGPCVVEGEEAHCGVAADLTKIDLNNGAYRSSN